MSKESICLSKKSVRCPKKYQFTNQLKSDENIIEEINYPKFDLRLLTHNKKLIKDMNMLCVTIIYKNGM